MAKKNNSAAIKMIDNQLVGLSVAEKLISEIVQIGLLGVDNKVIKSFQPQIKELGNYHIPGVQDAFIILFGNISNKEEIGDEPIIEQLNYTYSLVKQSNEYLKKLRESPNLDLDTTIEGKLRLKWKTSDLKKLELFEKDIPITQLSFYSYKDTDAKKWVNLGLWINLKTGVVYRTIKKEAINNHQVLTSFSEEDSVFSTIVQVPELFVLSKEYNPTILWEKEKTENTPLTSKDITTIHKYAHEDYAEVIKQVKDNLKNLITDRHPYVLLSLHKAFLSNETLVLEDKYGNHLTIKDINSKDLLSAKALQLTLPSNCDGMSLLVMINNDLSTGLLFAQPITVITDKVVRLIY